MDFPFDLATLILENFFFKETVTERQRSVSKQFYYIIYALETWEHIKYSPVME